MAATSTIQFTNQFEDETTAKISVGPVIANQIDKEALRSKVVEFNKNIATNGFATKMVSKGGAAWRGVSAVTITTTERDYLF